MFLHFALSEDLHCVRGFVLLLGLLSRPLLLLATYEIQSTHTWKGASSNNQYVKYSRALLGIYLRRLISCLPCTPCFQWDDVDPPSCQCWVGGGLLEQTWVHRVPRLELPSRSKKVNRSVSLCHTKRINRRIRLFSVTIVSYCTYIPDCTILTKNLTKLPNANEQRTMTMVTASALHQN